MDPCTKERELATLRSEVSAIFHRMDEQLTIARAVYDLAADMKVARQSIDILTNGQEKIAQDVEELKSKPGRRWESITLTSVITLISAAIGYALAHIVK